MKTIYVLGCSNESLNACLLLATLEYHVVLICNHHSFVRVMHEYQFDKQMSVLWRLYEAQDVISIKFLDTEDFALESLAGAQDLWLFADGLADEVLDKISTQHFLPSTQILISGVSGIGAIATLADKLKTAWVYYLPFIFMKDGANISAFFQADLVLVGEKTTGSSLKNDVVRFFIEHSDKQHIGDIKTAEFARSSIMGMLATRLSYMNEMARLADDMAVNIKEIETILGKDKRIGADYLRAGWGFGGKSLPSELSLLVEKFAHHKVETSLLQAVKDINEDQKELIFRKFWRYFDGFIEGKTVVIWGAGYRRGTTRTINSAIHPLLHLLWSYNIQTIVYVGRTAEELSALYGDNPLFSLSDDAYQPLTEAQALFIINWTSPVMPDVSELNKTALPIFDAKNVIDDERRSMLISDYVGMGR